MTSDIPGPLLSEALAAGLSEQDTLARWQKYVAWKNRTPGHGPNADYRMTDWRRHIGYELKDLAERVKVRALTPEIAAAREKQRAEEEQRNAARVAYAAGAVSFDAWVQTLPADHFVRRHREKHPNERPWVALLEAARKAG